MAASSRAYRPRHPEHTVLYRALAHHFLPVLNRPSGAASRVAERL